MSRSVPGGRAGLGSDRRQHHRRLDGGRLHHPGAHPDPHRGRRAVPDGVGPARDRGPVQLLSPRTPPGPREERPDRTVQGHGGAPGHPTGRSFVVRCQRMVIEPFSHACRHGDPNGRESYSGRTNSDTPSEMHRRHRVCRILGTSADLRPRPPSPIPAPPGERDDPRPPTSRARRSRAPATCGATAASKTKVLGTVALSAVVTGAVGFMGLQALGNSADAAETMYVSNLRGVAEPGEPATWPTSSATCAVNIRDTILGADPAAAIARIDTLAADFARPRRRPLRRRWRSTPRGRRSSTRSSPTSTPTSTSSSRCSSPPRARRTSTTWMSRNAAEGAPLGHRRVGRRRHAARHRRTTEAATDAGGIRRRLRVAAHPRDRRSWSWASLSPPASASGSPAASPARRRASAAVTEGLSRGDLTVAAAWTPATSWARWGRRWTPPLVELRARDGHRRGCRGRGGGVVGGAVGVLGADLGVGGGDPRPVRRRGRRAEEVSRSVQTVAAGAEQMGASIREIATNAAEASEVAARAVTAARDHDRDGREAGRVLGRDRQRRQGDHVASPSRRTCWR